MCACIYAGYTCAGVRVRAYAQNVCQTRPTPCTLHPVPSNVAGEQVSLHRNTIISARALVRCNCLDREGRCLVQQVQAQPLPGARFRGGNEYAGMYPAKMSTMVHIFADGARIRARICAPVHVYAGGGGGGGRCYTGTRKDQRKKIFINYKQDVSPTGFLRQKKKIAEEVREGQTSCFLKSFFSGLFWSQMIIRQKRLLPLAVCSWCREDRSLSSWPSTTIFGWSSPWGRATFAAWALKDRQLGCWPFSGHLGRHEKVLTSEERRGLLKVTENLTRLPRN